jgi:hypothetical protein
MSHATRINRILAVALLASTSLLTIAPVAEAGRYKNGHRHAASQASYRVDQCGPSGGVVVYRSNPAPILAGILGGFIVGAAYARSTPVVQTVAYAPAPPRYRYWDPYCDTWFVSLSECREDSYHHGHPHIVKVYDHDGDRCLRTMQWSAGAWYDI